MKGSGLLLEVTAPTKPETFDRFIARSREVAATWATWALTQRSITSAQKLIELALTSRLIIRATPFTVEGDGILEGEEGGRLIDGPGRFLDASDFEWLWSTPLGRRIERFGTKVKLDVLGRWLERAHDLPVNPPFAASGVVSRG